MGIDRFILKISFNKSTITRKELERVLDCLIKDELDSYEPLKIFETEIANLLKLKYAIATNTLTSAYHLIFKSLNIVSNDDEVILPSFMPQAPLNALSLMGGKPVLVDNQDNSFFSSLEEIKTKITSKTKAIIVFHPFGYHFDYEELTDLKIPLIEDISHILGTENIDEIFKIKSTFKVISFASQMIITTGNGGMILTNNSNFYSSFKAVSGLVENKINNESLLTPLQAALGWSQLKKINQLLTRRREIAKIYYEALKMTPHQTLISYNNSFAYQSFPVLFDAPNEKIEKFWQDNRIEIKKALPYPLHALLDINGRDFPQADRLSKKLYSLPIYPTLTKKEIMKISNLLASFL